MKIVFLGTACVFPTQNRNHTAVLLQYEGERLLFDCGEGTQRQLRIAGENLMKITKIFLTHWHGDHILGLAGLLQSMAMNGRTDSLDIFGPETTKERIYYMMKAYACPLTFRLNIHEINPLKPQVICEEREYEVLACAAKHTIPCIAFALREKQKIKIDKEKIEATGCKDHNLVETLRNGKDITWNGKKICVKDYTYSVPGKKLTYVMDTVPTEEMAELAKDSDLLICEATYTNDMKEKGAERGHMSAKQAAKLAVKAKAKQLVLTHFSQRYKDVSPLSKEARAVFKETKLAEDFMEIKI